MAKNQNYFDSLDASARARYLDKISLIENKDPYTLTPLNWNEDISMWADVEHGDIVNFLVYSTSFNTDKEFKSYKALDSYNFFLENWITEVKGTQINRLCVHKAKVCHSQAISKTPLLPWAIIQPDGVVEAAHCTCMAGLGEACSHIGALLFYIAAARAVFKNKSCTTEKAYWLPAGPIAQCPTSSNLMARVESIDFTSPPLKKKLYEAKYSGEAIAVRQPYCHKTVCKPTDQERKEFFDQLQATGERVAILSVLPDYQDPYIPSQAKASLPTMMMKFFNPGLEDLEWARLFQQALCSSYDWVTDVETDQAWDFTLDQSKCKLWFELRAGRITASNMYRATHSNPLKPSVTLIRDICYPYERRFECQAVRYGKRHEGDGADRYHSHMVQFHQVFKMMPGGFKINRQYPFYGASPDRLVECLCCGAGVLEIKCPLTVADKSIDQWHLDFLELGPTGMSLKREHPYYYQCITQMILCDVGYCDFVVWGSKAMYLERIYVDPGLWSEIHAKASVFHEIVIWPEILMKHFTRSKVKKIKSSI